MRVQSFIGMRTHCERYQSQPFTILKLLEEIESFSFCMLKRYSLSSIQYASTEMEVYLLIHDGTQLQLISINRFQVVEASRSYLTSIVFHQELTMSTPFWIVLLSHFSNG